MRLTPPKKKTMKMRNYNGVIWNALGSTMYGANTFIMLVMVSRIGTVEQAGAFSIAFTTAQLMYIIGIFGAADYQMTDYREAYPFRVYAGARLLSCLLMLLCCAGTIAVLDFTGIKRSYTLLLTGLMLLNALGELFQSLFFQKNRLDLSGSALFFRTLLPLIVFCGTIVLAKNILLAAALQILANLILTLYYAGSVAPRFLPAAAPQTHPDRTATRLLRECLPLAVSVLLTNVLLSLSKYGIEFLLDDTAQGYYSMIFIPAHVINLCSQFLFKPGLARYAELLSRSDLESFRRLIRKQLLLITALVLACCAGAYWLGTQILGFLYGKDLSAQAPALTVVILGGGLFAACQLFYYILVILRRQRRILSLYIGTTILALPLTMLLISRLGVLGAALAFVGTHAILLAAYLVSVKRVIGKEMSAVS